MKKGSVLEIPLLFLSRFLLFNLIAFLFYILSKRFTPSLETLLVVQGIVAGIFILGFPLMRRFGIAPIDFSPQFFFHHRRFPPGVALGFSLTYCSLPFIALLAFYSLYFKSPFLIFNLYALFVTLPTLILILLPEKVLKVLTFLIPAVPAITGFSLILAIGLFINFTGLSLFVSSLLQEQQPFLLLALILFILGFLTSLGPSTLPFLPVVFGILVTKHSSKRDITLSVIGFSVALLLTHAFVGGIASAGAIVLSEIFRTDIFNLFLAAILLLIALNLLNVLPFSLQVAKLNPFRGAGTGSFLLGVAYTFSLCPSCTSLLLGAIVLSTSTGNLTASVFLMGVYAVGRAIPVFLSGVVVSYLADFLKAHYVHINRLVGTIFLILSGYFFKNFLEVWL
ncbi:cytochrome c biogenesis CcdA family protein [Hydrogenivirga caldilitoris]|uniref:cytochrome c biogenesis CcdA family protein n=1 Tax=Hydrogenivirga caldilitoris TaxID=246264 RepID=UPI001474D17C|nr:cytochrome c biogenesis protein CcdA [Hydrogenivirga caldilitoris]